MSYTHRWKIVKELGSGGQGTVHLVEDKHATHESEVMGYFQSEFHTAIVNMSGLTQGKMQEAAGKFFDVLTKAAQGQIQPHHGALKVLHEVPTHGDGKSAQERIRREIKVLKDFEHPNVVKLLDSSDEGTWFVTEYFSHGTLTDNRERFRGKLLASLKALRPIVEALATLNSNGQVHRDVKPDNIFCRPDGSLVLGDFGLIWPGNTPETRVTLTEENVGSWQWMPPWAEGRRIDQVVPNFDVFTTAKVLWAMVSGQERLSFWYYSRDHKSGGGTYNLEKIFPESPEMKLANELFSKCIVEEEEDCLPSCVELLAEMDSLISCLERKGHLLSASIPRSCLVCGLGHYAEVRGTEVPELIKSLAGPKRNEFKVFSCNKCGHVQLFRRKAGEIRSAWETAPEQ